MEFDFNRDLSLLLNDVAKYLSGKIITDKERSLGVFFLERGISADKLAVKFGVGKSTLLGWQTRSRQGRLPRFFPPPKKLTIVQSVDKGLLTEKLDTRKFCEFSFPSGAILRIETDAINKELISAVESGVRHAFSHH